MKNSMESGQESMDSTTKKSNKTISGNSSIKSGSKNSLKDVFEHELQDIYGAEKQLIAALPKMMQAAYSEELQMAIQDHLEETKEQAKRLERIFERLGFDRKAKKCVAMEGLIEEGEKIIQEFEEGNVRDCALIIGAQKIEHYEIAAYGSLCELAEVLGLHSVGDLLDTTLEEEENADMMLTQIAEETNDMAMEDSPEFA
jgi:ferritin-like metal-binding protein YciE